MAFIKISDLLTFTVGKTYYVTFEGTEYECVAWAGDDGSIVIGNGSIYGGDGGNGEPFSCNSYADGSCYLNTNDYGTYDISISSMEEEIHYINPKYIKDMYYETDPMEITILGEQVIEGFAIEQDPIYAVENPFSINLVENQTYKVKWDGIIYNCICSIKSGVFYIGNVNYVDMMSGGDIPFCILKFDDTMVIATESTNVSHSIEILTMQSKIIKINEKYLPDDVVFTGTAIGRAGEGNGAEIFNDYVYNRAYGMYSHAEGNYTTASKPNAHAEGNETIASGYNTHAEGNKTTASGHSSHAEGKGTIAAGDNQHVQGKYNIEDTSSTYAHIVGNGTSYTARSNAHTLDWDGNAEFQGDVKANACGGENPISLIALYNTIQTLTERIAVLEAALNTDSLTETDANALVEEVFN